MTFEEVLAEFDVQIIDADATPRRPRQTCARAALQRVYDQDGPQELRFLLRVVCETHRASEWALAGHIVNGLRSVLRELKVRDESVLEAFDQVDLAAIDRRIRRFAGIASRSTAAAFLVATAVEDLLVAHSVTRRGRQSRLDRLEAVADRIGRWRRANEAEGETEASAIARAAAALGIDQAVALEALAVAALDPGAREYARRNGGAGNVRNLLALAALPGDQQAEAVAMSARARA